MEKNELIVIYTDSPKEDVKILLQTIKPEEEIKNKDGLIVLKPNLVTDRPASSGATTHIEIVEGIIEYFNEKGYHNLKIMEGAWVGARTKSAFDLCGYTAASQKYNVPLVDLQRDKFVKKSAEGLTVELCESVLTADYLINLPVLKGHCQTTMTCALKNMKGVITNSEKRKFHAMGLHRPIAALNKIISPNLTIVDGICGDLNFEAELMGISLDEVPYIGLAEKFGVGCSDLQKAKIEEINPGKKTPITPQSGMAKRLAQYVEQNDACSACYGSLIHALCRMQENGTLKSLKGKIYIGQGFKGIEKDGIGIGSCTKGFSSSLGGCPPTARAIREFLENL